MAIKGDLIMETVDFKGYFDTEGEDKDIFPLLLHIYYENQNGYSCAMHSSELEKLISLVDFNNFGSQLFNLELNAYIKNQKSLFYRDERTGNPYVYSNEPRLYEIGSINLDAKIINKHEASSLPKPFVISEVAPKEDLKAVFFGGPNLFVGNSVDIFNKCEALFNNYNNEYFYQRINLIAVLIKMDLILIAKEYLEQLKKEINIVTLVQENLINYYAKTILNREAIFKAFTKKLELYK